MNAACCTFDVVVDAATLRMGQYNVTGRMCIVLDGVAFPDLTWSDFPVIVLTWWSQAIARLVSAESATEEFLFMDGPYWFQASQIEADNWSVRCVRGFESEQEVVLERRAVPSIVISAIHRAAAGLVRECRQQGWWTRDIAKLEALSAAAQD